MNIKKGDNVQIVSGASRGKRGKVLAVLSDSGRILVEGVNVMKKHQKPKREGEKGEIVTLPHSINASNAMLVCTSCDKGVRAGYRLEGETKVRYCKNCQAPLEK